MGDDCHVDSAKRMMKSVIRGMPVWEYFDKFRAQVQRLEHDIQSHVEKLDEEVEKSQKLPNIDLKKQTKVKNDKRDLDLVLLYKKTHDSYDIKRPRDANKTSVPEKEELDDPLRTEFGRYIEILSGLIKRDHEVFAMRECGKPWVKCKVLFIKLLPRVISDEPCMTIRVEVLSNNPNNERIVLDATKYTIARTQNMSDKLGVTKRVIAGISETKLMPGIIANEPDEENNFRYLVFMDGGSACYYRPDQIYPIVGQSANPWNDSKRWNPSNDLNAAYTRYFFSLYPRRHIIKVSRGDSLELMRDGQLVSTEVIGIDCDTIRVLYKDDKEKNALEESIYRGSPRLLRREAFVSHQLAREKNIENFNQKIIWLAHLYLQAGQRALNEDYYRMANQFDRLSVIPTVSNKARKSTSSRNGPPTMRVKIDEHLVEDDRKHIQLLTDEQMKESKKHKCSTDCLNVPGIKTEAQVKDVVDEYRNLSDLKVPLVLGWKRKLRRMRTRDKSRVSVVYEAPCGKLITRPYDIRRQLLITKSVLDIDYFSFDRDLDLSCCVGELDVKYYVENIAVDMESGKPLENKFISLINQHNEERLPQDFGYVNETFPHFALRKKGFSFNTDFKSYCDCENDCTQRSSCPCHQLNEDAAGKNTHFKGVVETKFQYNHKRLNEQISTGIFECNSMCNCSSRCSNRVVQNGIRFRLQVTKTLSKGWGVVTLDAIPQGAFICTYAAELLDDADQYGDSDMYFADLDYVSVNERNKLGDPDSEKDDEGVEITSDDEELKVPKQNQSGKRKGSQKDRNDVSDSSSSKDSDSSSISSLELNDLMQVDHQPDSSNSVRYPKRKHQQQNPINHSRRQNQGYKRLHDLCGTHDFTLDARMQGNIGRFFNHSCDPNSWVQNVFIESHDLRFPVVAFFASRLIKSMEEITWNYNYKVAAIPGRRIDCRCGASNCKGRIL